MACAVILAATLTPMPHQAAQVALTGPFCLACGDGGGADFILNIALFLPLGAALAAAGFRVRTVVLLGLALSTGVELLQFSVIPGRDATIGDVVANTTGTTLGWVLAGRSRALLAAATEGGGLAGRRMGPGGDRRDIRRPAADGTLAPGGHLVRPVGRDGTGAGVVRGRGAVGDPGRLARCPHWRIEDWRSRRVELRARGEVRLEAEIVTGPATHEPLRIVALATDDGRFATLTQTGRDLHWGVRLRASDLGLRSPATVLDGRLPGSAGDTITVGGTLRQPACHRTSPAGRPGHRDRGQLRMEGRVAAAAGNRQSRAAGRAAADRTLAPRALGPVARLDLAGNGQAKRRTSWLDGVSGPTDEMRTGPGASLDPSSFMPRAARIGPHWSARAASPADGSTGQETGQPGAEQDDGAGLGHHRRRHRRERPWWWSSRCHST